MADDSTLVIADFASPEQPGAGDGGWRLVTDNVMGGVSEGRLSIEEIAGRRCVRLRGTGRTENNGGFMQAALGLEGLRRRDASGYHGVVVDIYGSDESYNLHLRQEGLWLPWQAFRTTFTASAQWQTCYLPFAEFRPHATNAVLRPDRLTRIGVVAIGRAFSADICVARIGYYRAP